MKLSILLAQRPALLQEARLANFAFAYWYLGDFAARIARARLRGPINLRQAAPDDGRCWATLTALEASQSVIEEHFTDEDLTDFADAIAFVTGEDSLDLTFPIEQLTERYLAPLRHRLEQAGITLDQDLLRSGEPNRGPSTG